MIPLWNPTLAPPFAPSIPARHFSPACTLQELVESLKRQSDTFLDTANALHGLSLRHEGARLPVYSVPNAIDVLTTGDYRRLPAVLGDVIVRITTGSSRHPPSSMPRISQT